MQRRHGFPAKPVIAAQALVSILACAPSAHATLLKLPNEVELRADRFIDAPVITRLNKNTQIDTLKAEAGWVQVRTDKATGWLKASYLVEQGAPVSPLAALEGGRGSSGNFVAASGIRAMPKPSRHALIVGVGQYMNPAIPTLSGVKYDMDSATRMAAAMSIPRENVRYIRDREATAERITKEINELAQRTQPGDRVFFYFSGHGSRWYDESISKDSCVEALLPADAQPLTNRKMAELLKPISDKADKLLVFYDACHSGGVVDKPLLTRSVNGDNWALTPKFTANDTPALCAKPVNIKTRGFTDQAQQLGGLPQNIVQISSSRPDEISFDDAAGGGLATQAWRDCMMGDAKDLDGSGGISVEEIALCTQAKLDRRFSNNSQFAAPHVTIGGNKGFIPSQFAASLPEPQPVALTAALASGTQAPAPAQPVANAAPHAEAQPQTPPQPQPQTQPEVQRPAEAALLDIYAQRDAHRTVSVTGNKSPLKIGADALDLSVTSSQNGYVYLILLGSDRKSYYMLFPNELDAQNEIAAGQPLKLPRPKWKITAQGPAGVDKLLVVVADSPRDLSSLGNRKAGPFLSTLTDNTGRANLQWLVGTSSNSAKEQCAAGKERNQQEFIRKCSDAFGAAMLDVIEQ